MRYRKVVPGIFIDRPNRFLAHILINGEKKLVHVRNSGRCREILIPGTRVYLEKTRVNHKRKTEYSLISALKGLQLINIDSQIPNYLVSNALKSENLPGMAVGKDVKREVSYKSSRFDMLYNYQKKKGFIEVKGVTLENNGIASFPDAPTIRGSKHINELITASRAGYENYIIFVIQMKGVNCFKPNNKMDPIFGAALKKAYTADIRIKAYDCIVTEDEINIDKPIEVDLD